MDSQHNEASQTICSNYEMQTAKGILNNCLSKKNRGKDEHRQPRLN